MRMLMLIIRKAITFPSTFYNIYQGPFIKPHKHMWLANINMSLLLHALPHDFVQLDN